MTAAKRLGKELKALMGNLPAGLHAIEMDESNMFLWTGVVAPIDGPYKTGAFKFSLEFPAEYPFKAPKFTFQTPIYHPNFDEKGAVCLNVLNPDNWKPATKVAQVVNALLAILNEPEPSHPLRSDLAEEFTKDRSKFDAAVAKHVKEHALPRPT